jgi:hypothetical protein
LKLQYIKSIVQNAHGITLENADTQVSVESDVDDVLVLAKAVNEAKKVFTNLSCHSVSH